MELKSFLVLCLALAASAVALPSSHSERDEDCGCDEGKVLPLLCLGEIVPLSCTQLDTLAEAASPGATLSTVDTTNKTYYYDGPRLTALYDKDTGETSVFPKLSTLVPGRPPSNLSLFDVPGYGDLFPADDTTVAQVLGSSLSGSSMKKAGGGATPPAVYLTEVQVQRNVTYDGQSFPVCGPGTKASFRVSSDGVIRSASHRWRTATTCGTKLTAIPAPESTSSIYSQMLDAGVNGTVQILDMCYYDGGNQYLQPVWPFVVTPSGEGNLTATKLLGYVPAAQGLPEPIPSLVPSEECPATAPVQSGIDRRGLKDGLSKRGPNIPIDKIKVGRYIQQSNFASPTFQTDAANFMAELEISSALENLLNTVNSLFAPPNFTLLDFADIQYVEGALPIIYDSAEPAFLDQVDLALTIGHGNYHIFATNGTCNSQLVDDTCAVAHIADMANFGATELRYWALKGCSIIPTPQDFFCPQDQHNAWDVWWPVFDGLHAAMGLRTDGWVGDAVPATFGARVGMGVSVVDAWLSTVHESPNYNGVNADPYWWQVGVEDQTLWKKDPHGQPSAVMVCGHADDTIHSRESLPPPDCLQMFWWGQTVWESGCDASTAKYGDGEWQVDEKTCVIASSSICSASPPPQ